MTNASRGKDPPIIFTWLCMCVSCVDKVGGQMRERWGGNVTMYVRYDILVVSKHQPPYPHP
jgi:hypothetical protein